jgi:hypothetical protein
MENKSSSNCKFLLGDWVEKVIDIITFGNGSMIAYTIAVKWLGFKSCGCEKRRIYLNKLTCRSYEETT